MTRWQNNDMILRLLPRQIISRRSGVRANVEPTTGPIAPDCP
ncbi:hypothetical protein [Homoserinimonas sp. OAct 916]|nr:hypothetical protein [Homoserinimonas sp. OAct 916]